MDVLSIKSQSLGGLLELVHSLGLVDVGHVEVKSGDARHGEWCCASKVSKSF